MGRPLREQVVVVTGASSGVGRAKRWRTPAREVRDSGGEALVLPLDVSALGSHERSLAAPPQAARSASRSAVTV